MAGSKRFVRALGPVLLLMLGGAYALGSLPWCRQPEAAPAVLRSTAPVTGATAAPLEAGAARAPLVLPFPVLVGGYGPPRPSASTADPALFARAIVLSQGDVSVGWVALELVTAPEALRAAIRARVGSLGLDALWVSATHTHTGPGGYDERWVSELAGTGAFRPEVVEALVQASASALMAAASQRQPVVLHAGTQPVENLNRPRSGSSADPRVTVVKLVGSAPVAQLVVLAAHPTIAPWRTEVLSGDFPSVTATEEEAAGHGVTLVLQGGGGNASVAWGMPTPAQVATKLRAMVASLPTEPVSAPQLVWSAVETGLPRVDGSRMVTSLMKRPMENILCPAAPPTVMVERLQLGSVSFLSVPGEPTAEAATVLEKSAGVDRVVGLTNGYVGYVETPASVKANHGEARRQYFVAELLDTLASAAKLLPRP